MRRTKEAMLITREQILEAAFDCFYENGFERTSLENIAERIDVTRGAIYWHFSNKKTLYRAAVDYALERGDIAGLARDLPFDITLQERLDEVFWMAINNNRYVDFVYKTIIYVSDHEEFNDILVKLRDIKLKLFQFFDEEINIYMRLHNIKGKKSENYSAALFFIFEGMFLTKNISLNVVSDKEHIDVFVGMIIHDLIAD
jgi:AcrR family transcriptional regulator